MTCITSQMAMLEMQPITGVSGKCTVSTTTALAWILLVLMLDPNSIMVSLSHQTAGRAAIFQLLPRLPMVRNELLHLLDEECHQCTRGSPVVLFRYTSPFRNEAH